VADEAETATPGPSGASGPGGTGVAGDRSPAEQAALDAGDETALSIAAARRYYLRDQSKVTIAKTLGLSRFQVARLLHDARRKGLVRIEIGEPGRVDRELSAAVRDCLGIARALVVQGESDVPRAPVETVGRALAEVLADTVPEGATLGLTWSRATAVMSRNVTGLRPCTVVQLAGAVSPPDGLPGSVEVTRAIAGLTGGPAYTVYAPLIVPDAVTADGLRRQPEIAATMAHYDRLDLAVLSVGAWRPSASAVYDLLEPGQRDALAAAGVCGEVSGRLFGRDGETLTGIDDRIIGVSAAQLRAIPQLITSSYGAYRLEATLAAVRAGFVHTLVTDDSLARALLDRA
jgi:DNA-binding transcriptional regulator LsrR (DeoR family)